MCRTKNGKEKPNNLEEKLQDYRSWLSWIAEDGQIDFCGPRIPAEKKQES